MNIKLHVAGCRLQARRAWLRAERLAAFSLQPSAFSLRRAFTLVEVMVVVVLLSLIILALMAVFNSTQAAFRASVTQAGVLEQGRATMDLMAGDLRLMSPSGGKFNVVNGAVNFSAAVTALAAPPSPLFQPMVGGSSVRTNVLENIFILSRGSENGAPAWYGIGYAVATNAPPGSLYSLYRFYAQTNIQSDPRGLFAMFTNTVYYGQWASMSHLMDGVVDLTVIPYDVRGGQMNNNIVYSAGQYLTNQNVYYFQSGLPGLGQTGFAMFSNTLPASVQLEMGVLEDRALQRAESLSGSAPAQANYLAGRAGQVHVFRQRVLVLNADPSAYQ
jgi:prepilin-type N-terminal cleavage/methylation domain-containing protein